MVEADEAGIADYFRDDAVCIIEWPERAGNRLPAPDLALSLSYARDEPGRNLVATARGEAGEQCLNALRAVAPPLG